MKFGIALSTTLVFSVVLLVKGIKEKNERNKCLKYFTASIIFFAIGILIVGLEVTDAYNF